MPLPLKTTPPASASPAAMFATKQKVPVDPLIANLLLFADWNKLVNELKPFSDQCANMIKNGYIIDSSLDGLLKSERGATKIVIMTKLNKTLIPPVINLLKSRYGAPLTDQKKLTLYAFYKDAPVILDLIISAIGKEAVENFAKTEPRATPLFR